MFRYVFLPLKSNSGFLSPAVKSALHLQKVLHVVFASNYVACIAGLSDRTTKGLQALHYTLSFLCKRGNKPPRKLQHRNHTASYKDKKKGKQQKNTSLNPELSCAHGNGCQNPMSIKPFASWRVRTFKFVRQHCKLCVQSCFDSFWFFVDVRLHNIFLFCFFVGHK